MCAQRRFKSACAFAQSNQNLHWAHFGSPWMQSFFMRTTKTQIRLRGCAVWFESSLGAYVKRYVFSRWAHIVGILTLQGKTMPDFTRISDQPYRFATSNRPSLSAVYILRILPSSAVQIPCIRTANALITPYWFTGWSGSSLFEFDIMFIFPRLQPYLDVSSFLSLIAFWWKRFDVYSFLLVARWSLDLTHTLLKSVIVYFRHVPLSSNFIEDFRSCKQNQILYLFTLSASAACSALSMKAKVFWAFAPPCIKIFHIRRK